MAEQAPKDHWTYQAYSASASFVPKLTAKVIEWLAPGPADTILDLGCGDGVLTAAIKARCTSVTGHDASQNLIDAARNSYGSIPNLFWHVQDCRYLENSPTLNVAAYTKVFSNAALHWILRDPTTRLSVLRAACKALKPGGIFVFEMGGAGNVAEVHAALLAAVVHQGLSIEAAREASPWFFPSETGMTALLTEAGFAVENSEVEYRPTRLTAADQQGAGGLEGWVRLMGAPFLAALDGEGRGHGKGKQSGEGDGEDPVGKERTEAAVREVCDVLKTVVARDEGEGRRRVEGGMWLGYVRLRVRARKKGREEMNE